ncbi:hypothetical protein KTR66_04715 [Roseococcus sp. SDR]|uniref:glycine-rich domain-containing protein n=1 Tax=Roseococcus sp. SDR TaxID=2835532 RepID=UPI001BCAA269|nr:hypothetical protein [Roseococcus sp. SDR]MBS7789282.1 hypothetical protein [Roseococcus sp. SDR]MBV1844596.1 hypothetical protein [Roseococcus sp. SDR]
MTQVSFPTVWGGSGIVYSDDGTGPRDMRDGGFRSWLLLMLGESITVTDGAAQAAILAAGNALGGAATQATSTTSLTIGTGSQALTVQTAKNFVIGMPVRIASSATNFMDGSVTAYNSGTGALTVSVAQTAGSGTFASWNVFLVGQPAALPTILREARSSNTALGTAQRGGFFHCTSSFTQTFAAAATLTNGWYCYIANNGSGDITLDPNGSEQIDGLTNFIMYPGEARLVICTGTGFVSMVMRGFRRRYDASGTFIRPPGYTQFAGLLWGAGGSGRKSSDFAPGGGGGACLQFHIPFASVGASETVTIGAGGAGVTASVGDGNAGGASSFGSICSAAGGGGGISLAPLGGDGGLVLANVTSSFWNGGGGSSSGIAGFASIYGGGGGGGVGNAGEIRAAGASTFGGAGGAGGNTTSGTAGAQPGGGGGGTRTGTTSGAGGDGRMDIWGVL